jgi:hypothetical protein
VRFRPSTWIFFLLEFSQDRIKRRRTQIDPSCGFPLDKLRRFNAAQRPAAKRHQHIKHRFRQAFKRFFRHPARLLSDIVS